MDENTFPNGRHRNKTYLQVFETDKDFCNMVLNGEKSRFIPDDFLQYLKDKNTNGDVLINERDIQYFLAGFNEKNITELENIIGLRDEDVQMKQVHPPCNFPRPNTFFGVFYHFFIQKHIANVANTNPYSNYINTYTTIFPFPVSKELAIADFEDGGIMAEIRSDEKFIDDVDLFLSEHFGRVDLYSILETFFANILNFRSNVVDERTIRKVLRDANLTNVLSGSENTSPDTIFQAERRVDYLDKYPRLNYRGVGRYRDIYNHFERICELYKKRCEILPNKYDRKYLLLLPEINFYELFSLLDIDMFNSRHFEYRHRFKKYLFFFVNALKMESNPVFFIDDVLFECLLNYTIFKEPGVDVLNLKYELSLLALAYVRKFNSESIFHKYEPNEENLLLVKTHLDSFTDLEDVKVGRYIRTEVLSTDVKVTTNEFLMDICYRHIQRDIIPRDFFVLVLEGALIDENVERLVIYNAYLGQETSIRMPEDKQKVVEFIRRLNGSDFSKEFDPEKLLFRESEEFYGKDVANWVTKF